MSPADTLWPLVEKMGSFRSNFLLHGDGRSSLPDFIEGLNGEGQEIELGQVEVVDGLLSSQGAQIVLYIPDQGFKIEQVLQDGPSGKKVHIADCQTLEQMRQGNRYDRYRAVVNLTGDFDVFGTEYNNRQKLEGKARLRVCQNCLKHLNYKGYMTEPGRQKEILRTFDLVEFFEKYSTRFRYLPTAFTEHKPGYSDNWTDISRLYRQEKGYQCENCRVVLSTYQRLLHVHHINGNKHDNTARNLMALCADCHRKQPMHDHMYVRQQEMEQIQKLRREQNIIGEGSSWADILQHADSAFVDLLKLYQAEGCSIPELGFELTDHVGMVIAESEFSWPEKKFAVTNFPDSQAVFHTHGWKALSCSEALRLFR